MSGIDREKKKIGKNNIDRNLKRERMMKSRDGGRHGRNENGEKGERKERIRLKQES